MDELVEWLTAQLKRQEGTAPWIHHYMCAAFDVEFEIEICDCGEPARVLREVEAKRKILWRHTPDSESNCSNCVEGYGPSSTGEVYYEPYPCWHIRALALPFADREGYRQVWGLG